MEITIKGEPKEIDALVLAVQERLDGANVIREEVDIRGVASQIVSGLQSASALMNDIPQGI